MPSGGEVSLGHLSLQSPSDHLVLWCSTTAHFRGLVGGPSDSNNPVVQPYGTTVDLLEAPWLHMGQTWKLDVDICLGDWLRVGQSAAFGETVGRVIQDAKMWHQLDMIPLSVQVEEHSARQDLQVSITFGRADPAITASKRRIHRLDTDVRSEDVRPPSGILSYKLSAVGMALQVSMPDSASKYKDSAAAKKSTNVAAAATTGHSVIEYLHASKDALDDLSACSPSSTEGCAATSGCFNKNKPASATRRTWDTDTTFPPHFTTGEYLSVGELSSAGASPHSATEESILSLIGAGVRYFLGPCPARSSKPSKVHETVDLRHLSDLAPAIYSLGYMPEVASRSCFLPTISHALARFRSIAVSADLRAKLRNNVGVNAGPHPPSAAATTGMHSNNQGLYMPALWNITAKALYDPAASKKLHPLHKELSSSILTEGADLDWFDLSEEDNLDADKPCHSIDEIDSSYDELLLDYDSQHTESSDELLNTVYVFDGTSILASDSGNCSSEASCGVHATRESS